MKKSKLEIVQIYEKLLDYFFSGVLAFVVLKTLREEFQRTHEGRDEIFISTLYISTYNTIVLALANTVKPSKESIHLAYLFNCIKESKGKFDIVTFNRLSSFMREAETLLNSITATIDAAITLRDTSVAHLDRRHINNPASLINNPPIKWDDIEFAYDIVGSALLETGKLLGLSDLKPYTALANLALSQQTRGVFRFLYAPDKRSPRKPFENGEEQK